MKICYSNSSFGSGMAAFIVVTCGGVVGLIQQTFLSEKCSHDNHNDITTFSTCLIKSKLQCRRGTDISLKKSCSQIYVKGEKIFLIELSPIFIKKYTPHSIVNMTYHQPYHMILTFYYTCSPHHKFEIWLEIRVSYLKIKTNCFKV